MVMLMIGKHLIHKVPRSQENIINDHVSGPGSWASCLLLMSSSHPSVSVVSLHLIIVLR